MAKYDPIYSYGEARLIQSLWPTIAPSYSFGESIVFHDAAEGIVTLSAFVGSKTKVSASLMMDLALSSSARSQTKVSASLSRTLSIVAAISSKTVTFARLAVLPFSYLEDHDNEVFSHTVPLSLESETDVRIVTGETPLLGVEIETPCVEVTGETPLLEARGETQ